MDQRVTKDDVIALHKQYPRWNTSMIAGYLNCTTAYVRATARRYGLCIPKAINSDGGGVRALKIELKAAQKRIAELEAEVQRCHARLEIDRYYVANEAIDDFEAVEVPMEERSTMTDGIECRDITIQLLEEDNAALVEELRARKVLEGK